MSFTSARRLSLAVLVICCFAMPSRAAAALRQDTTEAKIVRALNTTRASYGLPRLRAVSALGRAADAHSRAMRRTNTLDHGDFSHRIRRYVRSHTVGENLAWMTQCDANTIVSMWLNSAPHRRVMLSKSFRRIGVGRSGSQKCFVTADFASAR
jgi:uncharacterized protein YkwD